MTLDRLASIEAVLVGQSTVMRDLHQRIARIAESNLAVMIEGPTGSGKELVAQSLHRASGRQGECIAVNICAIPDGMFEDTLFGHTRGAFTGASSDHAGLFTEAHRGTLFLDEIGGLGLQGQAKLLRAIETRRFRPVGARADQTSDFRVVAASNVPLARLIGEGSFRRDLAERLRGTVIRVPALQDRQGDAVYLAAHFASGHSMKLSRAAQRVVERFAWPGNVRQLRHAIECASYLTTGGAVIDEETLGEAMESMIIDEGSASTGALPSTFRDQRTVAVLEEAEGNVERAASLLGIHRATLYRRLARMPGGTAASASSTNGAVASRREIVARQNATNSVSGPVLSLPSASGASD